MSERLHEQLHTFARHLRDPDACPPPPGLESRRVRVYRELFFNSIASLLAGSFPVIRGMLDDAAWKALVRRFYARHRSRTPLFPQVAGEFVAFLEANADDPALPPWLQELAHYEWVEQALLTSDAAPPAHDPDGDLLDGSPLLSPLAWPLAYRWPVQSIAPGIVPVDAPSQPATLLVHRDPAHHVRFVQIAPLVYRLLVSLRAHAWSGRRHLAMLAAEAGGDRAEFERHGLSLLEQLRQQRVVLGTVSPAEMPP